MKTIEISIKDVSDILGVSENTILKNWNKCRDKALQFNIVKEGRGAKASYIQTISENNNKIAYDILIEFLIQKCKFNVRTDFDKLIHYIYLVLLNTIDNKTYKNSNYMEEIRIAKSNLIQYKKKLTNAGVMQPKHLSKGSYQYMDMDNTYNMCDINLYDSFIKCIMNRAEQLIEEEYNLNLCDYEDYKKARDIITSDFDIEDIETIIHKISDDKIRKEAIKDNTTNISKINTDNILRFYKIAFFEVSKAWQKEFNIKHVKFFPNHTLTHKIINDMQFIEIILKAYAYTIEK